MASNNFASPDEHIHQTLTDGGKITVPNNYPNGIIIRSTKVQGKKGYDIIQITTSGRNLQIYYWAGSYCGVVLWKVFLYRAIFSDSRFFFKNIQCS